MIFLMFQSNNKVQKNPFARGVRRSVFLLEEEIIFLGYSFKKKISSMVLLLGMRSITEDSGLILKKAETVQPHSSPRDNLSP